jgi:hypothetical protein
MFSRISFFFSISSVGGYAYPIGASDYPLASLINSSLETNPFPSMSHIFIISSISSGLACSPLYKLIEN